MVLTYAIHNHDFDLIGELVKHYELRMAKKLETNPYNKKGIVHCLESDCRNLVECMKEDGYKVEFFKAIADVEDYFMKTCGYEPAIELDEKTHLALLLKFQ